MTPSDLNDRLLNYGASIIQLSSEFPKSFAIKHITEQLIRSGTSVGANYEEAQAAESKADFIHKLQIALKESRETHFWLRLLAKSHPIANSSLASVLEESLQVRAILSKAVATAKSRN